MALVWELATWELELEVELEVESEMELDLLEDTGNSEIHHRPDNARAMEDDRDPGSILGSDWRKDCNTDQYCMEPRVRRPAAQHTTRKPRAW
jgi:hypothetical protein